MNQVNEVVALLALLDLFEVDEISVVIEDEHLAHLTPGELAEFDQVDARGSLAEMLTWLCAHGVEFNVSGDLSAA